MSRKGHSPGNAACENLFEGLKNEFFYGRDWAGVTFEQFVGTLDNLVRRYNSVRLKLLEKDGRMFYDTIDNKHR